MAFGRRISHGIFAEIYKHLPQTSLSKKEAMWTYIGKQVRHNELPSEYAFLLSSLCAQLKSLSSPDSLAARGGHVTFF